MLAALDRLVTAERARIYAIFLLVGYVAIWGWVGLTLRQGLDAQGKPFGADFIIFYGASHLALEGRATLAYVGGALVAAERTAVPASRGLFLWCYPPTFQLVVWPLGLLPYLTALAAWTAVGLAAYLATMRQVSRDPRMWLLALAFPGVFVNAAQGQTGFLVTALMGGGLLLLDRRPWVAGTLLGLLAIKLQFGVLLPLLLIGTGRWKATAAAAASAGALAITATMILGVGSWADFLQAATAASRALASGALPLYKDPSLFSALLQFGAPAGVALVASALQAVVIAGLTLVAWRRPGPLELKAGLAVLATLIVLPYIFDYDLALLAIPIGVALKAMLDRRAPAGIRSVLVLLALTPILVAPLGKWMHLPLGSVALWCGFFAMYRLLPAPLRTPSAELGREHPSGYAEASRPLLDVAP